MKQKRRGGAQVHGLLAGTKTSVDHLLPKSEELLSQTQRQERAISNIHNDLKEKTREIMKELSDVERELGVVKVSCGRFSTYKYN